MEKVPDFKPRLGLVETQLIPSFENRRVEKSNAYQLIPTRGWGATQLSSAPVANTTVPNRKLRGVATLRWIRAESRKPPGAWEFGARGYPSAVLKYAHMCAFCPIRADRSPRKEIGRFVRLLPTQPARPGIPRWARYPLCDFQAAGVNRAFRIAPNTTRPTGNSASGPVPTMRLPGRATSDSGRRIFTDSFGKAPCPNPGFGPGTFTKWVGNCS